MQTDNDNASVRHNLSDLFKMIASTASKTISLVALEGRLAGLSLVNIFVLIVISLFLIFAAWLTLLIAAAVWLASLHIKLALALLIITAFNLLLLVPIVILIKHYCKKLFFPATRRQLKATKIQVMG